MKSAHILLVEDNEGDILLTMEALEESSIINTTDVVRDGNAALDYLFRQGEFVNAKPPDLILLDVNLPLKNGHEVLQRIKSDEGIKNIPVIMLTTSSSESDISLSYKHHANCYVTKPVDVNEFMKSIANIGHFWFDIVSLPVKHK